MIETESLCERLDWDSGFFGVSIAKAIPTRVDVETCRAILDWCRVEKIDCLYFLADDDPEARQVLENAGFVRVDERVTIELQPIPPALAPPTDTRRARDSDIAALREIAGRAHSDSRFYNDSRFDRARCDELYRVWIEKSCRGWADHVVVVERGGAAIGYLTVHLRQSESAMIGLVGVDSAYRRQGIGQRLMAGALAWLSNQPVTRVWSATQGRNAASQGFFQKAGFRPTGRAIWYHRWFSPSIGGQS
jgi:GNAT superfamily N-acetyltransferase